jgi:hypothetical protein
MKEQNMNITVIMIELVIFLCGVSGACGGKMNMTLP